MFSISDLRSEVFSACAAKMKLQLATEVDRGFEELHREMVKALGDVQAATQCWNSRLPAVDFATVGDPQRNLLDKESATEHLETGKSSAPQGKFNQYLAEVAEGGYGELIESSQKCPPAFCALDAHDEDHGDQSCNSGALIKESSKFEMSGQISLRSMTSCVSTVGGSRPALDSQSSASPAAKQTSVRLCKATINEIRQKTPQQSLGNLTGDSQSKGSLLWARQLSPLHNHTHPRLQLIVKSVGFEIFFAAVIISNCAVMGFEAEVAVHDPHIARLDDIFAALEHIFTTLFTIEFLMKWGAFGMHIFIPCGAKGGDNWWNLFDASLVLITGVLVTWLIPLFMWIAGLPNGSDIGRTSSTLLACRLARLVRVVKRVPQFREAWLILRGATDSMRTLFWTVVVIAAVTYIFAVVGLGLITKGLKDERDSTPDAALRQELTELLEYVGGLDSLMYTLVQVLTLDSFNALVRRLVKHVSWCWVYFYAYIGVAVFVLMNLVTATIVDSAVRHSRHDEFHVIQAKEKAKMEELRELEALFRLMDADGDDMLSWEEFKAAFEDEEMTKRWVLLDFHPEECKELFQLLDDNHDGRIEISDFFEGLAQMKGAAQSKHVFRLWRDVTSLKDMLQDQFQRDAKFSRTLGQIKASVNIGEGGASLVKSEENCPTLGREALYDDSIPIKVMGGTSREEHALFGASAESDGSGPKHKVLPELVEDVLQGAPECEEIDVQTVLAESSRPDWHLDAKPRERPGNKEVGREAIASVSHVPIDPEMPMLLPASISLTTLSQKQLPRPLLL